MNSNRFNSIILRPLRFLLVAFACTVILLSNVLPATALGNPSNLNKGEEHLDEIQRKTDQAIIDPPMNLKEIQNRSQAQKGGLNEVQGAADANKMSAPEISNQSPSVIDEVKDALRNLTNDKND